MSLDKARQIQLSAVRTSEKERNIRWRSGRFVKRANRLRGRRPAPSGEISIVSTTSPKGAYEVRLSESGALQWLEQRDGQEIIHEEEPGATIWRRAVVSALSVLPIEWLL